MLTSMLIGKIGLYLNLLTLFTTVEMFEIVMTWVLYEKIFCSLLLADRLLAVNVHMLCHVLQDADKDGGDDEKDEDDEKDKVYTDSSTFLKVCFVALCVLWHSVHHTHTVRMQLCDFIVFTIQRYDC